MKTITVYVDNCDIDSSLLLCAVKINVEHITALRDYQYKVLVTPALYTKNARFLPYNSKSMSLKEAESMYEKHSDPVYKQEPSTMIITVGGQSYTTKLWLHEVEELIKNA